MEDRIPEMHAMRNRKAGNQEIFLQIFSEENWEPEKKRCPHGRMRNAYSTMNSSILSI